MMSGQLAWMFDTFATMLPLHRAGKIRILGYRLFQRAPPIAPEIPTMIEAGVKDYEAYTFNLILGPAGMPKTVVDTLDQASRKLMADPDMVKFLNDVAAVPTPDTTPERTAKFIKDEIAKWAPVIKDADVRESPNAAPLPSRGGTSAAGSSWRRANLVYRTGSEAVLRRAHGICRECEVDETSSSSGRERRHAGGARPSSAPRPSIPTVRSGSSSRSRRPARPTSSAARRRRR